MQFEKRLEYRMRSKVRQYNRTSVALRRQYKRSIVAGVRLKNEVRQWLPASVERH